MPPFELTASEILKQLETGELSSTEIVASLIARRKEVDGRINAFVASMPDALERAEAADAERKQGGSLGPLHGLPMTIKDNVAVTGTDATLGMRSRQGKPDKHDAVLVAELRRLGAIVIGKTNVPQLLLAQETENAVFGVTNNPHNLARVPGGSSGGEAAAVAAGMSPLGIGTDIGGSIRIPAHFCGLYGFKPTLDRWSNRGSHTAIPGQEVVRSQIGCLARSASDVALLWNAVDPVAMSTHDPRVPPIPTSDPAKVDLTRLRIGWLDDDPFLSPAPSLRRAVGLAKEALEAAGATLVRHDPVPSEDILFTWLAAISADGGHTIDQSLAGEPVSPQLKPSHATLRVPDVARKALSRVLARIGERRVSRLLASLGKKPVEQLWALTQRRTDLRLAEFDRWGQQKLDALICPAHVVPALGHRESSDFALSLGAQFRWTLLDFAAGVAPVTTVTTADVGRYPTANDRIEKKLARIDSASVGLPVGIQIVARPYQEATLIAVMSALDDALRPQDGFPVTPVTP
jgi:fatty acid amide hydrolase